MSSANFASITGNLLARKGDAAPSLTTLPARPSLLPQGETPSTAQSPRPISAPPLEHPALPGRASQLKAASSHSKAKTMPSPEKDQSDRPRRIVVTLSAEEFERLCIAAIKKDCTRHAVVHTALEIYFHQLAAELPRRCTCMVEGDCCA